MRVSLARSSNWGFTISSSPTRDRVNPGKKCQDGERQVVSGRRMNEEHELFR
ncbi:hypothetical protein ASPVEDRAFT_46460 [Aspergillus versicolor CBS 583.65]|uniref:Uncharacterized protein n=1 Tax=Aspergillus versicolor CBS 583.65 TaxID=1036611 RepID=A0A1L9Q090_ASPVE|nr:uncharacterized protein ASPVEDRAFT_46460 [Aspergillus versicolor CBS 583.65]OJJ07082.1 hypothetical protein ASPVEDRAFT_46460 [Aspergillus versicolor CBS 583.65]